MLGHYLNSSTLYGYWPLQTNANDSSSNGYNMSSVTGVTYSVAGGRFGSGATFVNTASVYNGITYPTTVQNRTVSAWIYPTAFSGSGGTVRNYIWSQTIGAGGGALSFRLTSGVPIYQIYNGSNYGVASTYTCSLNVWTHLCVTVNGTTIKYYVNGVLHDTQTATGTISNFVPTYVNVGSIVGTYATGSNADSFVGNLCEVIVDNSVWSAIQIQKYYTQCKGRFAIT